MRKATQRLKQASRLLVVIGGEAVQTEVEAAFRLARAASAVLLTAGPVGEDLAMAMKSAGLLVATLGDLRRDASQAVLLGVSPETSAPRLWHFIGDEKQESALHMTSDSPLETLRWLRLYARRESFQPLPAGLMPIAQKIEAAPSGVVIFGSGWLAGGEPLARELLAWLADLNHSGRWYGLYLPEAPNSTGVTEALLSLAGFPGSLRFEEGRAQPVLYEVRLKSALLEAGAILLVGGSRAGESWPPACQQRTILLSADDPGWTPGLWLPVAQAGLDAPGAMLRLDGLPVELSPVLLAEPGRRPEAAQVLDELAREVAE